MVLTDGDGDAAADTATTAGTATDTQPTGQGRPRPAWQVLRTMLGDYWFDCREYVPTASLVALLAEFGIGEQATRAALSRMHRDGNLEGEKVGRHTAYRLAEPVRALAIEAGHRIMAFGAEPVPWDGTWTCVAFTVPESDRHLRPALRKRLRSLGLGSLFDGFWITPRAPLDRIDRSLNELGIEGVGVFRLTEVPRHGGVRLLDAWDLDGLRVGYDTLVANATRLVGEVGDGTLGASAALLERTELFDQWRELVMADPRLPDELLPPDWPLAEARRRFVTAYDALGPLAELRVRQVVATRGDVVTPVPRHHRAQDWPEAWPRRGRNPR